MKRAAQTGASMDDRLGALQCHFTWDLEASRSELLRIRDELQDIGTEEGYRWLGHIYNLQGYIHFSLDQIQEAQRFLAQAAEALRQIRNTVSDEGPWLLVNYSNRAWLHHQQGEDAQSRDFLSKVEALLAEYPSLLQDQELEDQEPQDQELQAEVCAERAWTLMKFGRTAKLQAVDLFSRAIRLQPEVVEWRSSYVVALANIEKHSRPEVDTLEKIRIAKDHDPDNLYLSALHLQGCAMTGRRVEDEARALAQKVLKKPVSSYSGIRPLLRLYAIYVSTDEAIDLAEGALERHPKERYLKRCAALCYKMKLLLDKDSPLEHSVMDRAISLYKDVIALYPDSSLKRKISLANIYAQNAQWSAAAQDLYQELLHSQLDPKEQQMLNNCYAKHLHCVQRDSSRSILYHMRAAAVPQPSVYRDNSIDILRRIRDRNRNRMCEAIGQFLDQLLLQPETF